MEILYLRHFSDLLLFRNPEADSKEHFLTPVKTSFDPRCGAMLAGAGKLRNPVPLTRLVFDRMVHPR